MVFFLFDVYMVSEVVCYLWLVVNPPIAGKYTHLTGKSFFKTNGTTPVLIGIVVIIYP
jgi:hypothetical protein